MINKAIQLNDAENSSCILERLSNGLKNLQSVGLSVEYKMAELTLTIGTRTITFNENGDVIGESN